MPTLSMSGVLKQRWQLVSRLRGGVSMPMKYGFSGCMPAVISSTERSVGGGTSEAEGRRRWPRSSKKLRNVSRIWSEVIAGGAIPADVRASRPPDSDAHDPRNPNG